MKLFLPYSCDEYENNCKTVFWYVAVNVYFCSAVCLSTRGWSGHHGAAVSGTSVYVYCSALEFADCAARL